MMLTRDCLHLPSTKSLHWLASTLTLFPLLSQAKLQASLTQSDPQVCSGFQAFLPQGLLFPLPWFWVISLSLWWTMIWHLDPISEGHAASAADMLSVHSLQQSTLSWLQGLKSTPLPKVALIHSLMQGERLGHPSQLQTSLKGKLTPELLVRLSKDGGPASQLCFSLFKSLLPSPPFYQYWSQEHFLINILFTLQGTQPVSLNSMDGSHQHPNTLLFFIPLYSQTYVQFLRSYLLFPLYYASFFFFLFNDENIQTLKKSNL